MVRRMGGFGIAAAWLVAVAAGFGPDEREVPREVAAPPGARVALSGVGRGVQIYKAATGADGKPAWALEGPLATLYDAQGVMIGYHYEGPYWESMDGSRVASVAAEPVKTAPAPDPGKDIPWLLVPVRPESAGGALAGVTHIQRLDTAGGQAPAGPPKVLGSKVGMPYSATYVFLRPGP